MNIADTSASNYWSHIVSFISVNGLYFVFMKYKGEKMKVLDTSDTMTVSLEIKKLLNYFLIADYSQTYFYGGHVSSLKYLLREADTYEVNKLLKEIQDSLENLYLNYYPIVEVVVGSVDVTNNTFNISIDVTVTNNEGITASLSNTVDVDNPYNSKHLYELKKIRQYS